MEQEVLNFISLMLYEEAVEDNFESIMTLIEALLDDQNIRYTTIVDFIQDLMTTYGVDDEDEDE
jgi:hypothetical protein